MGFMTSTYPGCTSCSLSGPTISCPVPVIQTKAALEKPGTGEVVVLLDEDVARENVSRLAASLGWEVEVAEDDGEYKLTLRKGTGGE